MFFARLFASLPLSILYLLADFLFFLGYYVVGYRRKVVFNNLRNAFPEKSEAEIKKIARVFYRHLTDLSVEVIHGLTMSEKELRNRVTVKNPKLLNDYYDKGESIVAMSSHQNNWEWFNTGVTVVTKAEMNGAYSKVKNQFFENLMLEIRTRFGSRLIEKKVIIRDLIKRKEVIKIVGLFADQSPRFVDNSCWTTFLNQETAFFNGGEKIAKKFNMPVFYAKMDKVKRGYYEVDFFIIDEPPYNPEPDFITRRFAELVEEHIRESPATWLWSHKRWKRKREKQQ